MGRCFWMRIKKLWDASSQPRRSGSWNALQSNWNHFLPMPANRSSICLRWKVMQLVMNTLIGVWTESVGSQLISRWFKVNEKRNAKDNSSKESRENVQKNNSIWPIDSRHHKCSARWCLFIIYVLKFLLQFSIFLFLLHLRSQFNSRETFSRRKQFFSRFAISIVERLKCKHNWNGADLCIESECGEISTRFICRSPTFWNSMKNLTRTAIKFHRKNPIRVFESLVWLCWEKMFAWNARNRLRKSRLGGKTFSLGV